MIYTAIWVTDLGICLWKLTFPAAVFFYFLHLYQKESERRENKKIEKCIPLLKKMLRDKTESKQNWADFIISKSDVWHISTWLI